MAVDGTIQRTLGKLEGTNEAILRELTLAREERAELRRKVAEQVDLVAVLKGQVEDIHSEITAIKPVVNDFTNLKSKAAGVGLALVFIGAVASFVFQLFIDKVKLWLGIN